MALEILNVLCPECGKNLKYICYDEPDEVFTTLYRTKQVFFGENYEEEMCLEEDKRLTYHCFNCNKSYSKDLTRVVDQEYSRNRIENIHIITDHLANEIADLEMEKLDLNDQLYLIKHPKYNYFGFGEYLRNKYVFPKKFGFKINADNVAHKAFNELVKRSKKKKFPKYDYIYVSVNYYDPLVNMYDGLMYYYRTDNEDIYKGDIVEVDRAGKTTKAQVAKVDYVKRNKVPYPLDKTKEIIKKVIQ